MNKIDFWAISYAHNSSSPYSSVLYAQKSITPLSLHSPLDIFYWCDVCSFSRVSFKVYCSEMYLTEFSSSCRSSSDKKVFFSSVCIVCGSVYAVIYYRNIHLHLEMIKCHLYLDNTKRCAVWGTDFMFRTIATGISLAPYEWIATIRCVNIHILGIQVLYEIEMHGNNQFHINNISLPIGMVHWIFNTNVILICE